LIVEATLHSFSLWHHFTHKPGFDAIAFAEPAHSMGLQGISLSLNNENYRHQGGRETARMDRMRAYLRILYDSGNSQMVLEDPIIALDAVLSHAYSVHFKDHVMIRAEDAGQLNIAGVPVGDGFLRLTDLTSRLLDQGMRRFTY
jgi:hypothetical protein